MARIRILVGLGFASAMMITAPGFAATTATLAKPAMHAQATTVTPKAKASTTAAHRKGHVSKATTSNAKKH